MKELALEKNFLEDLTYWIRTDRKISLKIMELMEAIKRDPCQGIGKPEPLCHLGSNVWSRRINHEHRLVYCIVENKVIFAQARHHY